VNQHTAYTQQQQQHAHTRTHLVGHDVKEAVAGQHQKLVVAVRVQQVLVYPLTRGVPLEAVTAELAG
jgi:hypothetical protein